MPETYLPAQDLDPKYGLYGSTVRTLEKKAGRISDTEMQAAISGTLIREVAVAIDNGEVTSTQATAAHPEGEQRVLTQDDVFNFHIQEALTSYDNNVLSPKPESILPKGSGPVDPNEWKTFLPRATGVREAVMTVIQNPQLREQFRHAVVLKQIQLRDEAEAGPASPNEGADRPEMIVVPEKWRSVAQQELGTEAVEDAPVIVVLDDDILSASKRLLDDSK